MKIKNEMTTKEYHGLFPGQCAFGLLASLTFPEKPGKSDPGMQAFHEYFVFLSVLCLALFTHI